MAEMGHTDSALALAIYAQAMRRDGGQYRDLRLLTEGGHLPEFETKPEASEVELYTR
jgi:hypothetical protein